MLVRLFMSTLTAYNRQHSGVLCLQSGKLWARQSRQGPQSLRSTHKTANEYLGLIERAENGAPRACANWTAPSSGQ